MKTSNRKKEKENRELVAKLLAQTINHHNLTVPAFSKKVGLDRSFLCRVLRAEGGLSFDSAKKIAKFFPGNEEKFMDAAGFEIYRKCVPASRIFLGDTFLSALERFGVPEEKIVRIVSKPAAVQKVAKLVLSL